MKLYYLINTELGWDNVVIIAPSIKAVYQNYYEGERYISDDDSKTRFRKDDLVLMDTFMSEEISDEDYE